MILNSLSAKGIYFLSNILYSVKETVWPSEVSILLFPIRLFLDDAADPPLYCYITPPPQDSFMLMKCQNTLGECPSSEALLSDCTAVKCNPSALYICREINLCPITLNIQQCLGRVVFLIDRYCHKPPADLFL